MTTEPLNRRDVLVIEDHAETRMLVTETLRDAGYTVMEAANGADCMAYLQAHPSQKVILLDLMMPVMTGWECRQWQRRTPALATIPVIVLSGVAAFSSRLTALDAQALLPKPFRPEDLLALVQRYVEPLP